MDVHTPLHTNQLRANLGNGGGGTLRRGNCDLGTIARTPYNCTIEIREGGCEKGNKKKKFKNH